MKDEFHNVNDKNQNISNERIDVILAQWQTCVEMANSVSERRDSMNNLFVSLNVGIMATISIVWDTKSVVLAILGLLVSVVWFVFIQNYRRLNSSKFQVICNMEKKLVEEPFSDEWKILQKDNKYIDSTKIERWFPFIFGLIYVVILILMYVCK